MPTVARFLDAWSLDNSNETHREILLNQTEIRLYLPFSSIDLEQQTDSARLVFQIYRKMVNTIWFRFYLIRFLCL